jgi:hypothetical protein
VAGCPIQRALCVEWDSTTAKSVGSPSSRRAGNKAPKPRCHPERSEGGGWATSPPLKQKYDPTQNQGCATSRGFREVALHCCRQLDCFITLAKCVSSRCPSPTPQRRNPLSMDSSLFLEFRCTRFRFAGSFTPGPAACVFFITTARFTHHRRISAIAP